MFVIVEKVYLQRVRHIISLKMKKRILKEPTGLWLANNVTILLWTRIITITIHRFREFMESKKAKKRTRTILDRLG